VGIRGPVYFRHVDFASERYVASIAKAMVVVLNPQLVGVYLHGSAVLGGFDARRSDVDIVFVSNGSMSRQQQTAVAHSLSEEALHCPARGLELSVVTHEVALHPSTRPPFELHITTAPDDSKVVDGHGRAGDSDLVLHFAVCRTAGQLIGSGLPRQEAFGPVPQALVLDQLVRELEWGAEHVPNEYAVLNACRAWRYATDGTLVSKVEGGEWALNHVRERAHMDLVKTGLSHQRSSASPALDPSAVQRFVKEIQSKVRPARL